MESHLHWRTWLLEQASAIALPVGEEQMAGVAMNLAIAARAAKLVEAVPLAPADEPAPVFVPSR